MARDLYAQAVLIAERLRASGEHAWAERLRSAIAQGSTSTEILMALRFELGDLLANGPLLEADTQLVAESLRSAIDAALTVMPADEAEVRVVGESVLARGQRYDFEHPVREAWWSEDLLLVLFDPDARTAKWGTFPNLVAVDSTGDRRWTAELPTTMTGDRYYRIASRDPLVAWAFSSFDCEIDPRTGRILRRVFTR